MLALGAVLTQAPGVAQAASGTVVALGASNTYGKGVVRNQAYPAQLEAMLKAAGHSVRVINAGINGDTTAGMLARLGSAVPNGTKVVILQPGGNDGRKGQGASREDNIAAIRGKLAGRGIKVLVMENNNFRGMPKQSDGMHLTPEGYAALARNWVGPVVSALGN
jgi:acyl-CoA thioesterase-1